MLYLRLTVRIEILCRFSNEPPVGSLIATLRRLVGRLEGLSVASKACRSPRRLVGRLEGLSVATLRMLVATFHSKKL